MKRQICVIGMGKEFSCSGCNWHYILAYYFADEPKPEFDKDDDIRLTNGLCAHCFLESLEGSYVEID